MWTVRFEQFNSHNQMNFPNLSLSRTEDLKSRGLALQINCLVRV